MDQGRRMRKEVVRFVTPRISAVSSDCEGVRGGLWSRVNDRRDFSLLLQQVDVVWRLAW
jgi:hypothetical protein